MGFTIGIYVFHLLIYTFNGSFDSVSWPNNIARQPNRQLSRITFHRSWRYFYDGNAHCFFYYREKILLKWRVEVSLWNGIELCYEQGEQVNIFKLAQLKLYIKSSLAAIGTIANVTFGSRNSRCKLIRHFLFTDFLLYQTCWRLIKGQQT